MRAKSQWTPGGITLWLIAAILATLIVCSETPYQAPESSPSDEIELEVLVE